LQRGWRSLQGRQGWKSNATLIIFDYLRIYLIAMHCVFYLGFQSFPMKNLVIFQLYLINLTRSPKIAAPDTVAILEALLHWVS
jgi:hypothetical protein